MPKIEIKYICKGCDEMYYCEKFANFKTCSKCEVETCVECGRLVNGKIYCPDCKPVEANWYDRSVE